MPRNALADYNALLQAHTDPGGPGDYYGRTVAGLELDAAQRSARREIDYQNMLLGELERYGRVLTPFQRAVGGSPEEQVREALLFGLGGPAYGAAEAVATGTAKQFARNVLSAGGAKVNKLTGRGTAAKPKATKAAKEEKRLGEGGSHPGTVKKERAVPFKGRQRMEFPGIYGNPRDIVADVRVAPENPMMQRLWGVTRADLADIARRPGNLPDWQPEATPARSRGSAAARQVMTPGNAQRIGNILEEGLARRELGEGMTGWYVMDPVYQRMEALLGPELARRKFLEQQTLISLASPGSDVMTEINRGSRAAWLAGQGRMGEFLEYGGNPGGRLSDPELEGLLGHAYHSTSQAPPMLNYLESGSLGEAAKVPAYTMAGRVPEVGFQTHYPVGDAHWARGVGLADVRTNKAYAQSAGLPEMTTLAPWYREIAGRYGLEAVPAQALQWGALSRQTGVMTPVGAPKLELLTEAIEKTARRTGQSPETVRDLFLTQGRPVGAIDPELLMLLGGASAGATAGAVLAGEE